VARFVIDCETLLRIASGDIEVAPGHRLFAPTLVRSQALAALYDAARKGQISVAEGLESVSRLNSASLKIRFLGDRALQRQAWKIAEQLGWKTTFDAEYVALTTLQADALVTSNPTLVRSVAGLIKTVSVDALRTL
jgi:indolepyruvate ferredoxin oxidoreductase alpha subunit